MQLKYKVEGAYKTYCPIPVHGVYLSLDSSNPSAVWPGTTWTQISAGRYLVASGSGYTVGSSYGANTVTLTVAQIPAHQHYYYKLSGSAGVKDTASGGNYGDDGSAMVTPTGGGQAHENRPLSYAVSMWRRTA
jgi:hypothetical protein